MWTAWILFPHGNLASVQSQSVNCFFTATVALPDTFPASKEPRQSQPCGKWGEPSVLWIREATQKEPFMRVPLSLLKSFVDISISPKALADLMNGRIAEVEHVVSFPSREALADVCVAEASELLDGNDDWQLWQFHVGGRQAAIVVGKKYNVQAGTRYAAICAGGKTPDGTTVEARQVGGFESQGMLVSESMLGIGEESASPLVFAPDIDASMHPYDLLRAGRRRLGVRPRAQSARPLFLAGNGATSARFLGRICGCPTWSIPTGRPFRRANCRSKSTPPRESSAMPGLKSVALR